MAASAAIAGAAATAIMAAAQSAMEARSNILMPRVPLLLLRPNPGGNLRLMHGHGAVKTQAGNTRHLFGCRHPPPATDPAREIVERAGGQRRLLGDRLRRAAQPRAVGAAGGRLRERW